MTTIKDTENEDLEISLDDKVVADASAAEPSVTNDELLAIRAQLDQANRDRESAERRAREAETARDQQAVGRNTEVHRRISAEEAAVAHAIAARTSHVEAWTDQIAALQEEGKFREAAQLSVKAAAAQTEIDRLQDQARQLVQFKARAEAEAQAAEADPFAHLPPKSQEWARKNPQYFDKGRPLPAASLAHFAALGEGLEAETPEYFDFIDRKLKGSDKPSDKPAEKVTTQERPKPTGAPVSRSLPESQSGTGTRTIRLNAEMREAAQICFPKLYERDPQLAYKEYAKHYEASRREGRIS